MFVTSKFNPDDLPLDKVSGLVNAIGRVNLKDGYTKADLESIENIVEGALSDVDGFNINEYGSLPTKTNIGMIERRLIELDTILRTRLRSTGEVNLRKYRETIKKFKSLEKVLDTIKDIEPNPIGVDDKLFVTNGLDSWRGSMPEKKYSFLTEVELSKAVNKLLKDSQFLQYSITTTDAAYTADRINLLLDRWYLSNTYKETLEPAIILKQLLNKTEIMYEDVVLLLLEPNKIKEFMDKSLTDLFNSINRASGILKNDYWLTDQQIKDWSNSDTDVTALTRFADDDATVIILAIVAIMRYRKPIEL